MQKRKDIFTKDQLVELTINYINGDIKQLTRSFIRSKTDISEHLINKWFGSFSEFKQYVIYSLGTKHQESKFFKSSNIGGNNHPRIIKIDDLDTPVDEDKEESGDDEEGQGWLFDPEEYTVEQEGSTSEPDNSDVITDNVADFFTYVKDGYVDKGNYWYNPTTKDYLFDFTAVPSIAKPIIIHNTQLFSILQAYSKFDSNPQTISAIAVKHKIPQYILRRILNAVEFTHDSLPVTNELIEEEDDDTKVIDDLMSIRQFGIYEKFTKRTWKDVQDKANKWVQFENGIYNPIIDTISTFTLPSYTPEDAGVLDNVLNPKDQAEAWCKKECFMITLSDIHFGAFADKNNLFNADEDWTIEKTKEAIRNYMFQISSDLSERRYCPEDCTIVSLGDLLHGLNGFTDKGTLLETQVKGITQFRVALESLAYFFQHISRLWKTSTGKIRVKAVGGNHEAIGDYCLMFALSKMFPNIDFDIASSRWHVFTQYDSLFVIEHGASSKYKSKVPKSDIGKENYIQKLILDKLDTLDRSIKFKYFMMGDLHHYSQKEMSSFEFIQVPTIVKDDEYADALNLRSRPRQLGFIIKEGVGIKEVFNYYFDLKNS